MTVEIERKHFALREFTVSQNVSWLVNQHCITLFKLQEQQMVAITSLRIAISWVHQ